jgi:hypothetical protein
MWGLNGKGYGKTLRGNIVGSVKVIRAGWFLF